MSIINNLNYLKDSKEIIRQSIEAKGVEVPIETPFRQYADKIIEIPSGGEIEKDPPDRTDINLYTSGSVNTSISSDGIFVNAYSSYVCALANTYNDSSVTIPLEKSLDHYEINLKIQTIAIQFQPYFGMIYWRGLGEAGVGNQISLLSSDDTWCQAKNSWNGFGGDKLYYSPTDAINVKYVFGNNTATVTMSTNETNSVTTTQSVSVDPSSINTIDNMYILGDSGDPSQVNTRKGAGKIFFKGTYIRDLDTGKIVWELCNGYNN